MTNMISLFSGKKRLPAAEEIIKIVKFSIFGKKSSPGGRAEAVGCVERGGAAPPEPPRARSVAGRRLLDV